MSNTARAVGLVLCLGMLAFSTWMYVRTGDWVAAVFAVASMGYGIFFMSSGGGFRQS